MTFMAATVILESTKQHFHRCWFAVCTGLVYGLAILLLWNSVSTYRWVSRPLSLEQPRSGLVRTPVAIRTAVFSPTTSRGEPWSLRRALLINLVASLALVVILTLLGARLGKRL